MWKLHEVSLQFSSPSLAPVCGTNCPKTDAFSAYDGCVFGIWVCVFGIVWNYAQKSPVRFRHMGMRFRHRGMHFQHPKNDQNDDINAFSASGYAFSAVSGTMLKFHICACGIGLRKHQCVSSIKSCPWLLIEMVGGILTQQLATLWQQPSKDDIKFDQLPRWNDRRCAKTGHSCFLADILSVPEV